MSNKNKHEYYDILNLIGYGLSKFNYDFINKYGFKTKKDFYNHIVKTGIAETVGTVKNRQDLFDGMTTGGPRKGWWQKGSVYKHRKDYIDSIFGNFDCKQFVDLIKMTIIEVSNNIIKDDVLKVDKISPITRSCFKQMQETGREAEYYFLNNYKLINIFSDANITDARLFGDGYDFQLSLFDKYYLAEVKGLRNMTGNIRLTNKEYEKAKEYKMEYVLVVVKNIADLPLFHPVFDPINNLSFNEKIIKSEQSCYVTSI